LTSLSESVSQEAGAAANPVHWEHCSDDVWWSTVNAGEAIPGVVTPLTGSLFGRHFEPAMKGTFYDMGVLTRSDVTAPPRVEDRLLGFFYGRAAGNLSLFRYLGDCTPGTSGDAIEAQIFGQVRQGVQSRPVYRRYPTVAARAPWTTARVVPRLLAATGSIREWWQDAVAPAAIGSPQAARAVLADAAARFERVMRPHTTVAMLCQGMYDQLQALAERAGKPGLELALATGYGNMAETAVVADLWLVSRGGLPLDEFIARHGFHGPAEGDLAALVWRLDREPIERLLGAYREMPPDRAPDQIERTRAAERRRAEAELIGLLPSWRRPQARLILGLAGRFIPQRGTGKAGFLRCIDVARTAARWLGDDLAQRGRLDDREDVFMLSLPELLDPAEPSSLGELARHRRSDHERFQTLELPEMFSGVPTALPVTVGEADRANGGVVVKGAAVSAGIVEGTARVVTAPSVEDDFEPGEILVCHTTDPSWASVMMLAAALVIDIGGPISHGAIVARELGIPCVIGTRDGTLRIRSGERVRVDAKRGEVVVLES
jgi:phosphohistidine swiveling domain-containing protein